MKSRISILALIVFSLMPVKGFSAEPDKTSGDPSYKVVIEVSIDGAEKWEGVLRNVENTRKELGPNTEIEVVTHGKGVGMLLLETQLGRSGHQRPADDACRNILYEYHIDRQLESAVCQAAITALSVRFKLRNFEAVSRRPNADRAL